ARPAIYTLSLHDALPICVVIEVSLSDDGSGRYAVKIYDNLDHARGAGEGSGEGNGGDARALAISPSDGDNVENDISLTFNFTARDRKSTRLNSSHVKISY